MHMRLIAVDATEGFLSDLEGVTDPEVKRKRSGERFIRVFEAEARKIVDWLKREINETWKNCCKYPNRN